MKPLTALGLHRIKPLNYTYASALGRLLQRRRGRGLSIQFRTKLVEAAGGPRYARVKQPHQTHSTENLAIEASPEGATGKSYLVYPGDQGKRGDADFDGHVGGYQDVYVKTPKGWRFQSRVHVFPPQIPGEYKGTPNTKLGAGGDK